MAIIPGIDWIVKDNLCCNSDLSYYKWSPPKVVPPGGTTFEGELSTA